MEVIEGYIGRVNDHYIGSVTHTSDSMLVEFVTDVRFARIFSRVDVRSQRHFFEGSNIEIIPVTLSVGDPEKVF
jgi:hypothetical protein